MSREQLRTSGRTWYEHVLAAGPELVMLLLSVILSVYFFVVTFVPSLYHYVEEMGNLFLPAVCLYMIAGGFLWILGWVREKRTSHAEGLGLDITGALLLTTGWIALFLGALATGGGDWTARLIALALATMWGLRALAAQRIQSGAEKIQRVIELTEDPTGGNNHGVDH